MSEILEVDTRQIFGGPNRWVALGAVLLLCGLVACSEDPDPDNNLLENGNNIDDPDVGIDADADPDLDADTGPGEDADTGPGEDADTGPGEDADTGDDADAGDDADVDDGEVEYPLEVDGPCGPMIDLGELEWGEHELEVDLGYFDNDLDLECQGLGDDPAAVYRFTMPSTQTGVLAVSSDHDVAGEFRFGGCGDDADRYGCYDDDFEMTLQPGLTHFLVLKPLDGEEAAVLDVTLDLSEMPPCFDDEGLASCVDDSRIQACQFLQASPDIPRELTVECPTGQCSDDRCQGDSCANPIEVSSSFQWSGRNYGFFDTHNSMAEVLEASENNEEATCLYIDDDSGDIQTLNTFGRELVFRLVDISEGDEVQIEVDFASPDKVVVLVKEECSDTSACLQTWYDYDQMTFVAPWDGDFYVIVDTMVEFDGFFDISITVD